MPKNLSERSVPVWYSAKSIKMLLSTALQEAETNEDDSRAYRLSMPLLASALLGDKKSYDNLVKQTLSALNKLSPEKNSFKAWIYGRVLLAADGLSDTNVINNTRKEIKKILKDKNTKKDELTAWAWCYLASLNDTEYNHAKENMKNAADQLSKDFLAAESAQESELHNKRAHALWAWVLCVQAAANADDKDMFEYALAQLKEIAKEETVAAALSKHLSRASSTANDYPAWAMAITRLAAATYGDHDLYAELRDPLQDALGGAAAAEALLAELNAELATVREPQLADEVTEV